MVLCRLQESIYISSIIGFYVSVSVCLCIYVYLYFYFHVFLSVSICVHSFKSIIEHSHFFGDFQFFLVQNSLKAQRLSCRDPSNQLHWKEVLIHEMEAESLLSSLPMISHICDNTCHMHYLVGREPCRETGIATRFLYMGSSFLPSLSPNPSHHTITSQPFSAFLECGYHPAFPLINYFKSLNSFNNKKLKTYLSSYKPHVPHLSSGCSHYL